MKKKKRKREKEKKHVSEFSKMNFPALTGLRAVGALMIFISHYHGLIRTPELFHNILSQMYVGISVFFVLSGFLLGLRYTNSLNNKKNIQKFYVKRVIRIIPLYWILIILTLWGLGVVNLMNWFMNFTLLKGFFIDFKFSGIAPSWALTVELTFYLLLPFIFYFSRKFHLLLQTFLFLIVGLILVLIGKQIDFYGFFGSFDFMVFYTFFGRAFDFLLGISLAHMFLKFKTKKEFYDYYKHSIFYKVNFTYLSVLGMIIVLFVMGYFLNQDYPYQINYFINNYIFPFMVVGLLFGLVVEKSIGQSFFSLDMLLLLGQASYAFYLIHFSWLINWIRGGFWTRLIMISVFSVLVYKLVELPIDKFLKKRIL